MTHSSDATVSQPIEQIWRDGLLQAFAWAPHAPPAGHDATSSPTTVPETAVRRLDGTPDIRALAGWSVPGSAEGTLVHRNDRSIAADRVLATTRPEGIVAALSLGGCRAAADRIRDLDEMTRAGAADEAPIVLASLRELALFLLSQRGFADPEIGIGPSGLLLAEWTSAERGVLAMKFLPGGMIQFAGVSAAGGTGPRLRVHGELPKYRALDAARAFIPPPSKPDMRRDAA